METQVRQTLERLNEQLGDRFPYRLEMIDPGAIRLLEKNARYMVHDTFSNLVDNVRRDGGLSSLPLCCREPGGVLTVLSGNHRVQAAVQAGLAEILVLVIPQELSREERIAIQLSHNALAGRDDMLILRDLWQEIADLGLKHYAGLDSETLGEIDKLQVETLSEARPAFEQIILQFLPEETSALREILDDASRVFSRDHNFVASVAHYEQTFAVMVEVKDRFNIVSNPAALAKVIELARERLQELPQPS